MSWRRWILFVTTIVATRVTSAQTAAAPVSSDELTSFARAKAETLLRRQLPCLGCHSLAGEGGKLAPDLATVHKRRSPEYIARIVADPQGTVAGTLMPHTPMPREWRVLVIRYLGGSANAGASRATLPPVGGPALRPVAPAPSDTSGAAIYAHFCTACHGAGGRGDGPNARALPIPPARHASREEMSKRPDDSLYDTIAGGGAIMDRSPRMPAYGTTLSPAQIRALVRHIRSLCQCAGPSWSRDGRGASRD